MQRDNTIDILKGIGIVLVVLGHTDGPVLVNHFIYAFHMPLFFIASGWFFSMKKTPKEFFKSKIRGLYLPFVIWSLVFVLLHNLFFRVGILTAEYGYQEWGSALMSWKTMIKRSLGIIFTMTQYDNFLLGTFWFVRTLFIALSLTYVIRYLINKTRWRN